jgi:2,4-dienoyl-CoA reductase-like NADH-dependent reductase (Old Yellow Enzyme family)
MNDNKSFLNFLKPGNRTMKLKNRIVMPSIAYFYPKPGGHIPQKMKDYLEE